MAVRLRLQRHGKKGKPFYHLVAADARAKRDGRFIEKLGIYNPNTNPATIEVVHDRALHWLQVGAEPSDTARAILKYTGAIYHNHLLNGVRKGAMTEAEAQKRFDAWHNEKQAKIQAKRDGLDAAAEKELKDRLAAERKQSEERADECRSRLGTDAHCYQPCADRQRAVPIHTWRCYWLGCLTP